MLNTLFKIFLISMTPVGELRVGIPYGLVKDINFILVFLIAVIGNMIPVIFLLWFLPWFEKMFGIKASAFYKHSPKETPEKSDNNYKTLKGKFLTQLSRLYKWYRNRTEKKYSKRFHKLGAIALITFVAIPLPITGAWTGTLAAHIFDVPPKKALPLIFVGVLVAGVIVTLIGLKIL